MVQRFSLSGINRDFLKKAIIIGGALVAVLAIAFLAIPTKYYFVLKGGKLELCVGRIGWIDGLRDRGFEPVYLGKEKDEELNVLLSKKFKTRDEALEALVPVALHRIHKRVSSLAEVEKSLFEQYHILLGEYMAAKQAGVEGLDVPIEALKGWLEMYKQHMKELEKKK